MVWLERRARGAVKSTVWDQPPGFTNLYVGPDVQLTPPMRMAYVITREMLTFEYLIPITLLCRPFACHFSYCTCCNSYSCIFAACPYRFLSTPSSQLLPCLCPSLVCLRSTPFLPTFTVSADSATSLLLTVLLFWAESSPNGLYSTTQQLGATTGYVLLTQTPSIHS